MRFDAVAVARALGPKLAARAAAHDASQSAPPLDRLFEEALRRSR
jgi:hypothetical protein